MKFVDSAETSRFTAVMHHSLHQVQDGYAKGIFFEFINILLENC
jgi:hypothetical protein